MNAKLNVLTPNPILKPVATVTTFVVRENGDNVFFTLKAAEKFQIKCADRLNTLFANKETKHTYTAADFPIDIRENGYCNYHGYSDVHPFEIVRVVSDKTLELRPLKSTLDPNFKCDVSIGGFVGHTNNNHAQSYTYEQQPEAPTTRVRKNKHGQWASKGMKFNLTTAPYKFYDYNF